ncbi:MAG TPA: 3-oxoacyl-[acyl-carrier-protein] synthase III C-terminal domain-containing protein, partial [Anaerolineales bacterium]|nr:3-oxoacyl-[acyl-carrier-protein] synthase III C-terminal domain-containing protein [Anaerolineales bacterium]
MGGVYGTWGESYDNQALPALLEQRLGGPIAKEEQLNLAELGFVSRHHIPILSKEQNIEVEVEVGARFLREAARASGWNPAEVEAVLIGMSAPITEDYLGRIAKAAGIPDSALKVAVHKACDGSTSSLHLALNPDLPENEHLSQNIAKTVFGKKVLVGGIEGLSRFMNTSRDTNALQLFGNAAGVIGIIPGKTMKFIAGSSREVYDEDGVLQVQMNYPHSPQKHGEMNVDVTQPNSTNIRIAGLMHEPANGSSIVMAGPMGMVKLFVRTGVQVVLDAYRSYQEQLEKLGSSGKELAVAIVHHANYKINKLKEKQLQNEGISLPMPWLLSEFGNVSAASNMIAFLRKLPELIPGNHVLIDGFGAGTYYDTLAVELGG